MSNRSKVRIYSITSSARALNMGGNSKSSAFAVLRLITSSNLTDCITGRSAGFSPLRIAAMIATECAVCLVEADAVAHQSAGHGVFPKMVDCGEFLMGCERDDLIASCIEERIARNQHQCDALLSQGRESSVDLGVGTGILESDRPTDCTRRF